MVYQSSTIYQQCCISSVQEIARALDGQRLPNNGQAQPDVIAGHLAVEVKCRELPQWLQDALSQAQRNALEGMRLWWFWWTPGKV